MSCFGKWKAFGFKSRDAIFIIGILLVLCKRKNNKYAPVLCNKKIMFLPDYNIQRWTGKIFWYGNKNLIYLNVYKLQNKQTKNYNSINCVLFIVEFDNLEVTLFGVTTPSIRIGVSTSIKTYHFDLRKNYCFNFNKKCYKKLVFWVKYITFNFKSCRRSSNIVNLLVRSDKWHLKLRNPFIVIDFVETAIY